ATSVTGLAAAVDLTSVEPANDTLAIDGLGGHDEAHFSGSSGNGRIDLSANGSQLRLARDGSLLVATTEVDEIDLDALDGEDHVTVNDLTGTGVGTDD